jgi:hypothetical protein
MFDMLTGQYKNLASKGRYGDTMLAHINPEEAALLKARGGAGTINPQTGLPEFYGLGQFQFLPQIEPEPLPSLGQALAPESLANLPTQLNTTTVPQELLGFGRGGVIPAYEKIAPEFDQYADKDYTRPLSGINITGYTIPSDQTFQGKPLEAKYDPKGNFQYLTVAGGDYLQVDPNQPNIVAAPKINAKGELIDYGVFDLNQQDSGGFGDFVGGLISDFAPMILAGIGANLLGPAAGAAGAAGGGGAAALSPYAAQAAGAYGGSAAAAAAAGAGSLAGIQAASAAQNALTAEALARTGITYGGNVTPADIPTTTPPAEATTTPPAEATTTPPAEVPATPPVVPPVAERTGAAASDIAASNALAAANTAGGLTTDAVTRAAAAAAGGGFPDLSSLGSVGSAILDFAKANPSIAGSLLGAVTAAVGSANAPTSQTSTTSIDPQIKAEYLANLERAKATAAGLEARQIAQPGQLYTDAESKLYNLGMTPFGATDIAKFYNPYQEQVVQGALGDIERTRLMQEQANRDQATRARAFGGSRQGVVTGMTNEAAIRQAANTGAQLRSAGFNQAANLGLQARPMDIAGLQTSLGLGTTRTALEQARLDALRNLGTERLGITSGALGLQPANVGGTTSQPLYNNTAGNLLSGGLTGAYIGSLLGK